MKDRVNKIILLAELLALKEAIEKDIDITSARFNSLLQKIKEKIAEKNNVTLEELKDNRNEILESRLSKRIDGLDFKLDKSIKTREEADNKLLEKLNGAISDILGLVKNIKVLTPEDVKVIAEEVVSKIEMPDIPEMPKIPDIPDIQPLERRLDRLENNESNYLKEERISEIETKIDKTADKEEIDKLSKRITQLEMTPRIKKVISRGGGASQDWVEQYGYRKSYIDARLNQDVRKGSDPTFGALTVDKLQVSDLPLLPTPVSGTIEFSNNKFYITNKGKQKVIDRTNDVLLETTTIANTTDEVVIWEGTAPANELEVGNLFKFHADGVVSSASASDTVTIRIKVAGETKLTLESEAKALDNDHWHLDGNATQRTIGVNGKRAMHMGLKIGAYDTELVGIATVDTTADTDIVVTAQWNNAKEGNTISVYQGFMGYRN
ncbi:MAG: hypothetical protein ACTSPI_11435 [Candidatus Heimdallarchaeaceae archaeon]